MTTLVRTQGNVIPAVSSLLNDFFADGWLNSSLANRWSPGSTLPTVNVSETNDAFNIEVAAPGMKRDNFNVALDNNRLTISAQREESSDDTQPEVNYTRREFNYQSFERSFVLPENKVDGEKIQARYTDGILHITVPKREEAKPKPVRQIAIS